MQPRDIYQNTHGWREEFFVIIFSDFFFAPAKQYQLTDHCPIAGMGDPPWSEPVLNGGIFQRLQILNLNKSQNIAYLDK